MRRRQRNQIMYFSLRYNYGFVNTGLFFVEAKNKAAAVRLARRAGFHFLSPPARINKATYESRTKAA